MNLFAEIKEALLHLAFPHICAGCGSDLLNINNELCLRCLHQLPATQFELHASNPIEKIFFGRLPVTAATAQYYFTKESLVQRLMHGFKYKGNKELGIYLGRLMGIALASSNRFTKIDALVPLPLFPSKERKRGYNQATVLCQGISEVLQKPVWKDAVIRSTFTETQTKKNRVERWQNIEGRFEIANAAQLMNKHVLLVDDVVTTGATLESCGRVLLNAPGLQLSIATLCFSSR